MTFLYIYIAGMVIYPIFVLAISVWFYGSQRVIFGTTLKQVLLTALLWPIDLPISMPSNIKDAYNKIKSR